MTIRIGQKAPYFRLYSSELKEVSLNDFKDKKLILHFFPMAFTGVCTEQLCIMRDNFDYYNNLNAEIAAISVDSPFTLAKFKEINHYPFTLLSDFNKEVSKTYDVIYDEFVFNLKGVSKRAVFVMDDYHKIVYTEVLESAGDLPNFEAIKKAVNT